MSILGQVKSILLDQLEPKDGNKVDDRSLTDYK